jgi:hypothetical protein
MCVNTILQEKFPTIWNSLTNTQKHNLINRLSFNIGTIVLGDILEHKMNDLDDLINSLHDNEFIFSISCVRVHWYINGKRFETTLADDLLYDLNTKIIKPSHLSIIVDELTDSINIQQERSYGYVKIYDVELIFGSIKTPTLNTTNVKLPLIIKYYRLTLPKESNEISNGSSILYQTIPSFGPIFSYNTRYMCEDDFITPTTDLLSFIINRNAENKNLGIPSTVAETLYFISEPYQTPETANMLIASASYIDSGTTIATTLPYLNYPVITASGKYAGYTNVKIIFDNGPEKKRTVYIT